jgi:hypothetical protein
MEKSQPVVVKGSLEIIETCNGYALYGKSPTGHDVFLAHMGDGVGTGGTAGDFPNPNADPDLPEAYGFRIVSTVAEFRRCVKETFPHVKIQIRTISFTDLARGDAKALTVIGDHPGELAQINELASKSYILGDNNIRVFENT